MVPTAGLEGRGLALVQGNTAGQCRRGKAIEAGLHGWRANSAASSSACRNSISTLQGRPMSEPPEPACDRSADRAARGSVLRDNHSDRGATLSLAMWHAQLLSAAGARASSSPSWRGASASITTDTTDGLLAQWRHFPFDPRSVRSPAPRADTGEYIFPYFFRRPAPVRSGRCRWWSGF